MRAPGLVLLGLLLTGCSLPFTRQHRDAEQWVVRAEAMTQTGNYPEAHAAYGRALNASAKNGPTDRVLFGLARLYTMPENPNRDYRRAYEHLERLLKEHPQSQRVGEARAWRDLLATFLAQREEMARLRQDVQRIRQDLERLKQLELELERQRRR